MEWDEAIGLATLEVGEEILVAEELAKEAKKKNDP
jgi:hypothetical protein